jgi:hypothetical protein
MHQNTEEVKPIQKSPEDIKYSLYINITIITAMIMQFLYKFHNNQFLHYFNVTDNGKITVTLLCNHHKTGFGSVNDDMKFLLSYNEENRLMLHTTYFKEPSEEFLLKSFSQEDIDDFCTGSAAVISEYLEKRLKNKDQKPEHVNIQEVQTSENIQTIKNINIVSTFNKYCIEFKEGGYVFMDIPEDAKPNFSKGDRFYTDTAGQIGVISKESIH